MGKSRTYKEIQATKTYVVVNLNGVCIGIFTNLRAVVETISEEDNNFSSYWTLIGKDKPVTVQLEDDVYVFSEYKMNVIAVIKEG